MPRPSVTLAAGIKKADGRRTKWVDSGGAKTSVASNEREASKVANNREFNTLETIEKQKSRTGDPHLQRQKSP